jgi:hypothetical protein
MNAQIENQTNQVRATWLELQVLRKESMDIDLIRRKSDSFSLQVNVLLELRRRARRVNHG